MAKIPLRAYNRDIENMINRGQIDEAVGHCKHILRFFPKHIDTYRLLGKAYLEGQHFAEAYDVLQRVLSTVPDDFISQIGLSIIREDEGNLDAAIWHMERAFEVQPANTAVQGELRRLYGRRDGIEPPKIRLTRGALIRMYARGELYQQAIGEIRTALAEDPKRIDFEITLARMYYLSGMKVEATEVCSRVISKLPFCFEANRILAEILPETARANDAKIYQQRVDAMDPYAAYIAPNTPTIADVPDNVVTLERLEWDPEAAASQKPEWARTVGIEWEEQKDVLPEWLDGTTDSLTTDEKPIVDDVLLPELSSTKDILSETPSTTEAGSGEQIPDWMQAAGWGKSSGEETPQAENAFLDEAQSDGEIAGGEIPAWLQSMAPQQSADAVSGEDEERLNQLSSILPESGPLSESAALTTDSDDAFSANSDLPEWMKQAGMTDEPASADTAGQEKPDWLNELASETGEAPAPNENLPAWMQTDNAADSFAAFSLEESIPDLTPQDTEAVSDQPVSTTEEPAITQASGTVQENPDDAFAWLEALATRQGAAEETLLTNPSDRVDTPPEWLQQIEDSAPTAPAPSPVSNEVINGEISGDESADAEMPDWLKTLQAESGAGPVEPVEEIAATAGFDELPAATEAAQDDIPDWLTQLQTESTEPVSEILEDIEAIDHSVETQLPSPDNAAQGDVPDWLKNLQSEENEPVSATAEVVEAIDAQADPNAFGLEISEGKTPNWMKDLEAQPGITPPESVGAAIPAMGSTNDADLPVEAEAPDWLKELQEVGSEPAAEIPDAGGAFDSVPRPASEADLSSAGKEAMDADSAFAWLESLAARQGADEETLLVKPEDRLETPPEWVQEPTADNQNVVQVPAGEIKPTTVESESSGTPVEEIPDWMKTLQGEQQETPAIEAEPVAEATSDDLPDWLSSTGQQEIAAQKAAPESSEEIPSGDDAFAWLEALAAKQGADEETLLLKPEERLETPPDWLAEQAAEPENEGEEPVASGFTAKPSASGVTDWLKALEGESPVDELESTEIAAPPETAIPVEPVVEELPESQPVEATTEFPHWLTNLQSEPAVEPEETKAPLEELAAVQLEGASDGQQEVPEPAVPIEEQPEPAYETQGEDTLPTPVTPLRTEAPVVAQVTTFEVQPVLQRARAAIARGRVREALIDYQELIRTNSALGETIQDLQNALFQHPVDIDLWQAIGDAYARSNRLQDALDSYTKAEELLR